MKVLSLFNGCGMVRPALAKAGIEVTKLDYCEIDKVANSVMKHNYPQDTLISTDVTTFFPKEGDYDLIVGGFPCQQFSVANKNRKGLEGGSGVLFYEAKRIIDTVKPQYFILENVASMKKDIQEYINEQLGVQPIMLDASWFSAQRRKRLFWTNIQGVTEPLNKSSSVLKDILETQVDQKYYLSKEQYDTVRWLKKKPNQTRLGYIEKDFNKDLSKYSPSQGTRILNTETKTTCLPSMPQGLDYINDNPIRKLTPVECERLMGLKDNYTQWGLKELKDGNRYKLCGNGFVVQVVAYILNFIK
jgi:DNA-cytosine methyltransferase